MRLYVEGGGDSSTLKTACRAGFSEFLRKAGLRGYLPRIVACGSRTNAMTPDLRSPIAYPASL